MKDRSAYHAAWRKANRAKCCAYSAKYRLKYPEKILAYSRTYKNHHPDYMVRYEKERYRKNKRYFSAKCRAYRQKNPAKIAEYSRIWRKKNPEKIQIIARNQKYRRLGAKGKHTQKDLDKILHRQNNRCVYCSADLRVEKKQLDHRKPIALGGSNYPRNLQFLCVRCNRKKYKHTEKKFLKMLKSGK